MTLKGKNAFFELLLMDLDVFTATAVLHCAKFFLTKVIQGSTVKSECSDN